MSRKFCNAVNCHYVNLELTKEEEEFWCQEPRIECDYLDIKGNLRKKYISYFAEIENIRSLKTLAAYLKYIKK